MNLQPLATNKLSHPGCEGMLLAMDDVILRHLLSDVTGLDALDEFKQCKKKVNKRVWQ